MDDQISSRRALLRLATLAAGGLLGLRSLREATPDKGGHRERAIALIQEAMGEVQAGIDYAARKFGD